MWLEWNASIFSILLGSSLRILAVAALTVVIVLTARIRAARVQHGVWTAVLFSSLLMPFLPWVVPPLFLDVAVVNRSFSLEWLSSTDDSIALLESSPARVGQSTSPHGFPMWLRLLVMSYTAGMTGLLLREGLGWFAMRRLVRSSQPMEVLPGSDVYESNSIVTPVTCGVFRTRVVLPAAWKEWAPEKLRAVLVHENAHRTRRDPLIGFLARINRAIFWFHPIAWWLERKLADTAEQACDDEVVIQLGGPEHYARVLIEIAEAVHGSGQRVFWEGVGMAGKGVLSHRIDRLLKGDVAQRVSVGRKTMVGLLCFGVVYLAAACRQETTTTRGVGAEILIRDKGASYFVGMQSAVLPIEKMTKDLLAVPGVKAVAPIVADTDSGFAVAFGIDPESFNAVRGGFKILQGKMFEKPGEAVIDDWQQSRMKVKVGDRVKLLKMDFTIAGVVEHGRGARIFIPLQALQEKLKLEGLATLFYVKLDSGATTKQVIGRIKEALADDSKEILDLSDLASLSSSNAGLISRSGRGTTQ